jgi:hypothetical protein
MQVVTTVSEERVAVIFRIVHFKTKGGCDKCLLSPTRLHGVTTQKTTVDRKYFYKISLYIYPTKEMFETKVVLFCTYFMDEFVVL